MVTAEEVEAAVARGDPGADVLLALGLTSQGPQSVPRCETSSAASVLSWCKATGLKFVDPDFSPCLLSLSGEINAADTAGRYHDVEWVRAQEACAGALLGPNDAVCGQLGDPFFVATLPDNAASAFGDIEVCGEGVYEVTVNGQTVVVDDFVPAVNGLPEFTKSASGLMWPLIYEKACAKLAGSYDALSAMRRGEATPGMPEVKLPAVACPSERRAFAVKEFIQPALAGAALSGHSRVLEEFAQFFMATQKPGACMDGVSRAMASVGDYSKYSFPLRAPALNVKVNSDTIVNVDATRDASAAEGKLVLCICEVTEHSWRLLSGTVAADGAESAELTIELKATGNNNIVFCGTPVSEAVPDIELNISSDKEIEINHA
jgi:hypothetical protein